MALLRWMLSVVAVFFSLVLIDQWLWPLTTTVRYIVWVGFVGGTGAWFATKVLPLIGRNIHPHYAARQIEATLPGIKDGLITWVQLSGSDSPPPKSVLNAVGRYVARQLKGQDIASVIDQLNPLKLAAALMGLSLLGAIYLATSPKNVPATIQRLLMPWANVAPATRVQIVSVTPGDTAIIQGSNASIGIQVKGWQRQDKAIVQYSTDDGQTVDQFVAMNSDIEGLSYRVELGKTFGGILQPMHYIIKAGDATAGPFAIKVQAIPLSILEQVEYIYPEYTRLNPRIIEADGRIEGPEGTRIRIVARGNQPMKSARVEFDSTFAKDGSFQPEWIRDLAVEERLIRGDWVLEVNEKRSNPSRFQYRVRSTNMLGETAPEPVIYPMTVVADLAPEIDFAASLKESIEVPANSSIEIEVRANDPDFGLIKVVLDGTPVGPKVGRTPFQEVLLEDANGVTGQVVRTLTITPAKLGYQANDTIDLVLTATDNRHSPVSNKLASNIVKSKVVSLKITPPSKENSKDQSDPKSNSKESVQSDAENKNDSKGKSTIESATNDPKEQPEASAKQPTNPNSKADKRPNKQNTEEQSSTSQKTSDPTKTNPDESGKEAKQPAKSKDGSKSNDKQPANQKVKESKQAKSEQSKDPKNSDDPKSNERQKQPSSGDSQSQPKKEKQPSNGTDKNQKPNNQTPKDQKPSDQGGQDQGAGDEQSDTMEESGSDGESGTSQKSASNKSGGKPRKEDGEQSTGDSGEESDGASDPNANMQPGQSKSSSTSKPDGQSADPGSASGDDSMRDEPSDEQTPTHDGEAFERLQKILDKSEGKDSRSENANPKENENVAGTESIDSSKGEHTNQSGKAKGEQSKSGNPGEKGDSSEVSKNSESNQQPTSNPSEPNASQQSDSMSNPRGESSKPSAESGSESGTQNEKGDSTDSSQSRESTGAKSDSSKSDTTAANSDSGNSKPGDSKSGETKSGDSKAGDSKPGDSKSGNSKSGDSKSGDSKSGDSKPGDSKGGAAEGEKGQEGGQAGGKEGGMKGDGSASSGPPSGGPSSGGSSSGGSKSGVSSGSDSTSSGDKLGDGTGSGAGVSESSEEAKEYAKSATDFVLESLKRQREQPDPELLTKMGWSKKQMQAFVDRWQNAREQAVTDPTKKKEYEDMLQSLGLVPQIGSNKGVRGRADGLSGVREEGSRIRPPESLRERFEAFRKATQQPSGS